MISDAARGGGGGLGWQGSEFLAMVLYIIISRLLRLILGGLTYTFLSNTDKCMPWRSFIVQVLLLHGYWLSNEELTTQNNLKLKIN